MRQIVCSVLLVVHNYNVKIIILILFHDIANNQASNFLSIFNNAKY